MEDQATLPSYGNRTKKIHRFFIHCEIPNIFFLHGLSCCEIRNKEIFKAGLTLIYDMFRTVPSKICTHHGCQLKNYPSRKSLATTELEFPRPPPFLVTQSPLFHQGQCSTNLTSKYREKFILPTVNRQEIPWLHKSLSIKKVNLPITGLEIVASDGDDLESGKEEFSFTWLVLSHECSCCTANCPCGNLVRFRALLMARN